MQALAVKHARDGAAFAAAVTTFYRTHAGLVQESMCMSVSEAESYCAGQAEQAIAFGVKVSETWGTSSYAAGLAAWALGGVAS